MILSNWMASLLAGFVAVQAAFAIDITVNDQGPFFSCFQAFSPR